MKTRTLFPAILATLASLFFVGCTISTLSVRPTPEQTEKRVDRSLSRADARMPQAQAEIPSQEESR